MTPVDVVIVACALVGFVACATTSARAALSIARGARRPAPPAPGSAAAPAADPGERTALPEASAAVALGLRAGAAPASASGPASAAPPPPLSPVLDAGRPGALPDAVSCVRALVIGAAMLAAMLAAHALAPLGVVGSDAGLVGGLGLVALALAAAAHARRGMTRAALGRGGHGDAHRLASRADLDAACLHDVLGCALSGIVLVVGHGLLHAHAAAAAGALGASGHAHSAGLPPDVVLACLAVLAAAFAAWTLVLARGRRGIRLVELVAMGAMPAVMVAGTAVA